MREEPRAAIETPLAILPPPSLEFSNVSSLKSTARSLKNGAKKKVPVGRQTTGVLGVKRKTPSGSRLSKRAAVMPPSSSVSSLSSPVKDSRSYTIRGVRKSDGGYAKGVFRKGTEENETSKDPFWLRKEKNVLKGFFSDSEDEKKPKGPTIASLRTSNRIARANIEKA